MAEVTDGDYVKIFYRNNRQGETKSADGIFARNGAKAFFLGKEEYLWFEVDSLYKRIYIFVEANMPNDPDIEARKRSHDLGELP